MKKLTEIKGIGTSYTKKLKGAGVVSLVDLLGQGFSPQGRKEMAEKSSVSDKLILKWVNMADLFRIKGVGEQYTDLLEASGVETVAELAHRNPDSLQAKWLK